MDQATVNSSTRDLWLWTLIIQVFMKYMSRIGVRALFKCLIVTVHSSALLEVMLEEMLALLILPV